MRVRANLTKLVFAALTAALLLAACNRAGDSEQSAAEAQFVGMEEQLAALRAEMEESEQELEEARQRELSNKIATLQNQLAATREEMETAKREEEAAKAAAKEAKKSSPSNVREVAGGGSGGVLTPAPPAAPMAPTPLVHTPEPEPEPAPEPEPRVVTLKAGTPLTIRTTTAMSTKTVETGQTFEASLEEPLTDGEWIIASRGARVTGVVAESSKGRRGKNDARLVLRVTKVYTDDGQALDINTKTVTQTAVAPKKTKQAAKVGIASGVGAAIGAIAGGGKGAAVGAGAGAGAGAGSILLTHGRPAEIAAESVLNLQLANDITVTEQR